MKALLSQKFSFYLCLFINVFLYLPGSLQAEAGEPNAKINAILILASDSENPPDKRLAKYQKQLGRLFKFKHYQYLSEQTTESKIPGNTKMALSDGFRLQLETSYTDVKKIRAKVLWQHADKKLLNTTVVLKKASPVILGGPAHKNGNLILILSLK